MLVLPVLLFVPLPGATSFSMFMFHLAVIWGAIAWRVRDAVLAGAAQAVLTIAAVVATSAWLQHGTTTWEPADVFRPQSLQAYAFVLGLLSLAWVAARIFSAKHDIARKLLNPPWPPVDWVVRHGVIWLQLLIVVGYLLLPGIGQEL